MTQSTTLPPLTEFPPFVPFPGLADGHAMTIAPALWPRHFRFKQEEGEVRLFEVAPGVKILTRCHWQAEPRRHPTLLLLHGLEGSTASHFMRGTAEKAFALGMNIVRMNHRNCGGSLHLTPTLYNSGLSGDPLAILKELKEVDGLGSLCVAGWSLGGNVMLKLAGELGDRGPHWLSAVCAVSPSMDLHSCVDALELQSNRFYATWFLRGLKAKIRDKQKLFPEMYDASRLATIESIRQFDDFYTAPIGGYGTADNYYTQASSLRVLDQIRVPTLIIQSKDDPFVPFSSFTSAALDSEYIHLLATKHGGHAGFIHRSRESRQLFDRFWAENRVVDFVRAVLDERKA